MLDMFLSMLGITPEVMAQVQKLPPDLPDRLGKMVDAVFAMREEQVLIAANVARTMVAAEDSNQRLYRIEGRLYALERQRSLVPEKSGTDGSCRIAASSCAVDRHSRNGSRGAEPDASGEGE